MATTEELRIHEKWCAGYRKYEAVLEEHLEIDRIVSFRSAGVDDETIAAGFVIPVETIAPMVQRFEEAMNEMATANREGEQWIEKNGPSPLLEGYDGP